MGSWWVLLRTTFEEWNADNATRLAAALAYYTIFSIAPLLVLSVAIAGMFLGREAAQGQLVSQIGSLVGNQAVAVLIQEAVIHASVRSTGLVATVIGLILLFWGAAGVFGELRNSLNSIWDVPPRPHGPVRAVIFERTFALLMVVVSVLLLLASLIASTWLAAAGNWFQHTTPDVPFWTQAANFVFFFFVTLVVFVLIYRYVPDLRIAWRDVWFGAVATALLFSIGRLLISWYLSLSPISSGYGAASSLAVLLLWTYYSAQVFFLGAEFTQVYGRTLGSRRNEHQLIETPIPATPAQTVQTYTGTIVPAAEPGNAEEGAPTPALMPAARAGVKGVTRSSRRLITPLVKVGAAFGVIAVLSIFNLVVSPLRR
jgi:membrane protein